MTVFQGYPSAVPHAPPFRIPKHQKYRNFILVVAPRLLPLAEIELTVASRVTIDSLILDPSCKNLQLSLAATR